MSTLPRFWRENEILLLLSSQVFLVMLGLGLVTPILPLYAQSFGVSAAAVGSLVTVFGIARMVINIPAGQWTERFGRRILLISGPLIASIGSFGFAFAGTFWQLLVWRMLQGIGSAVITTAAMVMLADLSSPSTRGRVMSLYQGALLLGSGAGPAFGGLLAEAFGIRVPFFIFGGLTALAGLWAFLRIPETRGWSEGRSPKEATTAATRPRVALRPLLGRLLSNRDFLLVSAVTLGVFFTRSGGQMTLLPLLGHNKLGMSEAAIGATFTLIFAVNLASLYAAGMLSDRFGPKAVIVPSGIVTALSISLFFYTGSIELFLANAVLFGIGTGMSGPAPAAYATDISPRDAIGPAMGLYRTISDLGLVIGPILLGWLADRLGYRAAFWTNAGLVLFTSLAFGLFARRTARGS